MFTMMYDFFSMTNEKKEKEKKKHLPSSRICLFNKSLKLYSMQVMIAMVVMVMVLVVPSKGAIWRKEHYCLQANIDPDHFETEAPIAVQVEMIRMLAGVKPIHGTDIVMISDAAQRLLNEHYRGDLDYAVIPIDLQSDEWFGIGRNPASGFQYLEAWLKMYNNSLGNAFTKNPDLSVITYCNVVRDRKALQVMVAQLQTVLKWFTEPATRQPRLKAFFRLFVRLMSFKPQEFEVLHVDVLSYFLQRIHLWPLLCGGQSSVRTGANSTKAKAKSSSEELCISLLTEEVTAQSQRHVLPPKSIVWPIWLLPAGEDEPKQREVTGKINQMLFEELKKLTEPGNLSLFGDKGDEEERAFYFRSVLITLWPTIKTEAGENGKMGKDNGKWVALGTLGVGAVGGYGYPYVKTWVGKVIDYMFDPGNKSTTTAAPIMATANHTQTNDTGREHNNNWNTSSSSVLWIVALVVVVGLLLLALIIAYFYGWFGNGGGGKDGNASSKSSHSNKSSHNKSAKPISKACNTSNNKPVSIRSKHNTDKAITTNTSNTSVEPVVFVRSSMKHSSIKSKSVKPPVTPTGATVTPTVTPTATTSSAKPSTKKSSKKSLV